MKHVLRLFITGRTGHSQRAVENLTALCERELGDAFHIEVIDVLEHPELAEEDKILATPTLVRKLPPPVRKLIGDMSRTDLVVRGLEIGTGAGRAGEEDDR